MQLQYATQLLNRKIVTSFDSLCKTLCAKLFLQNFVQNALCKSEQTMHVRDREDATCAG